MACTHTNINCGCKDSFLTTPAPCPTPEGCPDPQPCSEVFDAQCIVYTGDPIICDQDTVVATNDTVADALNQVVDYFCGQTTTCCTLPEVDIVPQRMQQGYTLLAIAGGVGPYTYQWTIEQDALVGLAFSGITTNNDVLLVISDINNYTPVPALSAQAYQCLVRVKLTDGLGQIATAYYNAVILEYPA